jgi:hypothetical protein
MATIRRSIITDVILSKKYVDRIQNEKIEISKNMQKYLSNPRKFYEH